MLYESFCILYEECFIFCVFVFTLSLISMVKGYGKKHTYSKYYNGWFCMRRIYLCITTQRTVSLLFLYGCISDYDRRSKYKYGILWLYHTPIEARTATGNRAIG